MRKSIEMQPRLVALSTTEAAAQSQKRSWMSRHAANYVALDPARWSQRTRQLSYWLMAEIGNNNRSLH